MSLTQRTLTVTLADQAANPIVGAVVTALLDRSDIDASAGMVLPEAVEAVSDDTGVATLQLWPNALGSQGSRYTVSVIDAAGTALFTVLASMPDADTNLWSIATLVEQPSPFPSQDDTREARLVQDVLDLLHQDAADSETTRKVKRWLKFVTDHMQQRPWWFLRRIAGTELAAGNDVVDLRGAIQRVEAVYAPMRLKLVPLGTLVAWRAQAAADGAPNAGEECGCYAIEAGYRLHLWPAPSAPVTFRVLYQRPLDLALLPESLEPTIVNGVLGRYGRHFDRDALSQDPAVFEQRYQQELAAAASGSFDAVEHAPLWENPATDSLSSPQSSGGQATTTVVPASVTGVGYVSIETGEYPLVVG